MRMMVLLAVLACSGCKHLPAKKDKPFPPLVPPSAEVKEEPRHKTVSITLLKIDNLTIKAF